MLARAVAPAVKSAVRSGKVSRGARSSTVRDVKYTKTGKIARGSRKLYNDLMNAKYGKPLGKHGMTWSQLADKGYGGGAPAYVAPDAGDDGGDD